MNVQRIFFWLRFFAELTLEVLDEMDYHGYKPAGSSRQVADPPAGFKPERIQYWIGQMVKFVLEVAEAASEETGKSGERSVVSAADSEEVE